MNWESILKKRQPRECPDFPRKEIYYTEGLAKRAQKRLYNQTGVQYHIYTCSHRFRKRKNSEKTRPHWHLSKRHYVR